MKFVDLSSLCRCSITERQEVVSKLKIKKKENKNERTRKMKHVVRDAQSKEAENFCMISVFCVYFTKNCIIIYFTLIKCFIECKMRLVPAFPAEYYAPNFCT